jgi:serine/threonine-protein kinase RsbW
MVQKKNESHQMNIPSSQRHLKKVVAFVEGLAQKAGFREDAIVDIAISASEAVNNAILHGNKKNRKKKVTVLVETKGGRFIIRVIDQGTAFTPAGICNPLDPENLMKCSGRGILIQRSLMDEVNFRPAPGGGTEVELIKSLPAASAVA